MNVETYRGRWRHRVPIGGDRPSCSSNFALGSKIPLYSLGARRWPFSSLLGSIPSLGSGLFCCLFEPAPGVRASRLRAFASLGVFRSRRLLSTCSTSAVSAVSAQHHSSLGFRVFRSLGLRNGSSQPRVFVAGSCRSQDAFSLARGSSFFHASRASFALTCRSVRATC